jgi:transposase-like protein
MPVKKEELFHKKVTREMEIRMVQLRTRSGFSLSRIALELGLVKDTVHKHLNRLIPEHERMMRKKMNPVINRVRATKTPPVREGRMPYTFLKFLRVAMTWATAKYKINRYDVEVLLYLYAFGVFTRKQFFEIYGISTRSMKFYDFVERKYIVMYRPPSIREIQSYILSEEMMSMCKDFHLICLGDRKMETQKCNPLRDTKTKEANKYLEFIRKMNKSLPQKK